MTDNPQPEPVNPCTRGASFCGQHGYECPPSAPADRAAILREAATQAKEIGYARASTEAERLLTVTIAEGLRRMADKAQQPETQADNAQFGSPDCTCIPWTREGGTARYCQPGDTVDQISGWERGGDCPHHRPTP